MKIFQLGKLPLLIGLGALLVSCDQKEDPKAESGNTPSTAELAREAEFGEWESKAGLLYKMEQLDQGKFYYSSVEGRLYHGKNQYRAIVSSAESEKNLRWGVFWGLTENELAEKELLLLRAGFERHEHQVFTDSTGLALHQLVMLKTVAADALENEPLVAEAPAVSDNPASFGPEANILDSSEDERIGLQDLSPTNLAELEPEIADPNAPPIQTIPAIAEEVIAETTEAIADIQPEPMPLLPEEALVSEEAIVDDAPDPTVMDEPGVGIPVDEPEVEPEPEPEVVEPEPEPEPEPAPANITYKVVRGDNLSKIARDFKVSVKAIKKANGLRSDMLRIGQVLKIPSGS